MDAPTFAAITRHPTGGGIAAVADLVWRVFQDQWGARATLVSMFDHENRSASAREKARFAASLASAQALGRTDWILFGHLGLAQVQTAIPRSLRCRHGVLLYGIEAWNRLDPREHQALADADVRIAISEYTARRVRDLYPDVGPIDVCALALPLSHASPRASAEHGSLPPLGPHVVLVVARMLASERYKGHDQLIDAWPHVVARVPDAQLVIVGDGDDRPRLMDKARRNAATTSIVFTGFVPDSILDTLYERASVFALPSRGEGFGLVYLEAMAHGLPCVGSIHDAACEVIVDGRTGRLVDQGRISNIVDALSGLLEDKEQRRMMGAASLARVQTDFSFDRFRRRLCHLIGAVAHDTQQHQPMLEPRPSTGVANTTG